MVDSLSPNTQAVLLLTAPLIAGRGGPSPDALTPGEYKRLARLLHDLQRQPSDLLSPEAEQLIEQCAPLIDSERLRRLLARGFLLSQSIERWQARAIWVVSRADAEYPVRLKERLGADAPSVVYGCGDAGLLDAGGLAVVGSREVDDALLEYTESIGRLAARAGRCLVSGGARGIDQAGMRGAVGADGRVVGVLADSLERTATHREHRNMLLEGQLVLVSPYDPAAGFNVGHAMQRNKLIYALADAALVVSSDYERGGTWAGAVEQLEKLHLVPTYVRCNGKMSKGLEALRRKGALEWPEPSTPDELVEVLDASVFPQSGTPYQTPLALSMTRERTQAYELQPETAPGPTASQAAEELFAKVKSLLTPMHRPRTDAEVAAELNVSKTQATEWLERLVEEGSLERVSEPPRYRSPDASRRLL